MQEIRHHSKNFEHLSYLFLLCDHLQVQYRWTELARNGWSMESQNLENDASYTNWNQRYMQGLKNKIPYTVLRTVSQYIDVSKYVSKKTVN